jgi:hypothetical protein
MSAAILLAEATLLPSGVDLSLFSILVKSVGKREVLVQVRNWLLHVDIKNASLPCSAYRELLLLTMGYGSCFVQCITLC